MNSWYTSPGIPRDANPRVRAIRPGKYEHACSGTTTSGTFNGGGSAGYAEDF